MKTDRLPTSAQPSNKHQTISPRTSSQGERQGLTDGLAHAATCLLLGAAACLPGVGAPSHPQLGAAHHRDVVGRRGLPHNAQSAPPPWSGTWAASPQDAGPSFEEQTLRQIVHTSIGGTAARVQISNVFGSRPVEVAHMSAALAASGSSIVPNSQYAITFGGAAQTTIMPGSLMVSDAIPMPIPALSDVAISLYLPASVPNATCHRLGQQTNYIANGDVAADPELESPQTMNSYCLLSNLDVQSVAATGAVVALGASITDGLGSTPDTNGRWPNFLAQRLVAAGLDVGVLNQGISGNRLLSDGSGQSALVRVDRDAFEQPNVKWVIFSDDPINDLGGSADVRPTASQLIAGLSTLVNETHQHGLKFLCSTLTPFQGAGYWSQDGETKREAINTFIRSAQSGCDGVIDQDMATHDPNNTTRLLPAYDSGDYLHPNEDGMHAIADAVNLALLQ